jgi:hypothetical protein
MSGANPAGHKASPAGTGTSPAGPGTGPAAGGSRPATGRRRAWLRAGLILLAVIQAGQGVWQYFAPRSFYFDTPTVAADPPFNGHLLTDVGGLNLALAVVLAAAAWRLDRTLTRAALAAYLVYSVSHLAFHAADQARLTAGSQALLITGLALLPALAAALLMLTTRPGAAKPSGTAP